MAKFCGKCGSPLNENGLCPRCAPAVPVEEPAAPQAAPSQTTVPPAAPSVQPPVPGAILETPAPVKKKSKLKIIIPIAAAVVLIGALVFCAFFFHWFGLGKSGGDGSGYASSQHKAFVTTSYGNYAGSVNTLYDEVDMLDESQRNRMLMFTDDEGTLRKFFAYRMAQDGDTFYGSYQDQLFPLIKLTVKDDQTAERSVWVSEEKMKNSILQNSEDRYPGFVRTLDLFQSDGDYVYANIAGTPEFFYSQKAFNYRIVRIRKDSALEHHHGTLDGKHLARRKHCRLSRLAMMKMTLDAKRDHQHTAVIKSVPKTRYVHCSLHDADAFMRIQELNKRGERVGVDDRVVVEEENDVARHMRQGEVISSGKAEVLGRGNVPNVGIGCNKRGS